VWKIIKTEIKYNKIVLAIGFFCIFTLQLWINIRVSNANALDRNIDALLNTLFLICLSILIISYSLFLKEKRYLLHSLMPVSRNHLGLMRLLLYLSLWICSVLLLLLTLIIANNLISFLSNWKYLLSLGSYTGLFLFINAFFLITSDLSGLIESRNTSGRLLIKNIAYFSVVLYVLVIIITPSPPMVDTFAESVFGQSFKHIRLWLFQSGTGFYLSIFLGSSLSVLSVYTFKKRKSYLE
jgi:hypothetical protein